MNNFQDKVNFIWTIAELLRGPYKKEQYGDVVLPMAVLRRFDCVLAPTMEEVLKKYEELKKTLSRLNRTKAEYLSTIIEQLNKRFGTDFTPADQLSVEQIKEDFARDAEMVIKAKSNSIDDFRYAFQKSFMGKVVDRMGQNEKFFMKILDDEQFANALMELMLSEVYDKLQNVDI